MDIMNGYAPARISQERQEQKISVIVRYKYRTLLERAVDSILSQTYRNLEVILVDDGSRIKAGSFATAIPERTAG